MVETAEVLLKTGLVGDHHANVGKSERQVTLIQAEHFPVIASMACLAEVGPEMTRRNLVVRGINLWALHDRTFSVGDVVLKGTGPCDPCSRMETALGPGGFNAMRGHGGITAVVVQAGEIAIGDAVRVAAVDE